MMTKFLYSAMLVRVIKNHNRFGVFCWFVPSQCDFIITRWVSCCHEHWWIIWFNRFLAVRSSSSVNTHLIQLISMATGVHLPTFSYTRNPPLSARSCGDVPFGCAHLLNMHYSYPQCPAFSPCFLPPPWLGADYDCAWLCWRRSVDVVFNLCHPEGELGAGAGNAAAVCVYVNKVCVIYNHPQAAGIELWRGQSVGVSTLWLCKCWRWICLVRSCGGYLVYWQ